MAKWRLRQRQTNAEAEGVAQKNADFTQDFGSKSADASDAQPEKKRINGSAELDFNNATLAELAEVAQHYSDRSFETLRRLNRAELINIIKNEADNRDKGFNGLDKDADNLLKLFVELLDEIKRARDNQPLNPTLKRIFCNQNNKLTEILINANVKSGFISVFILIVIATALIFDTFIGFDSISKYFKAKREAKEARAKDQQSNQSHSSEARG